MKYYGYLVVAGSLVFNDHKCNDTLRSYAGGAMSYEAGRVMVTPGIERNGSVERFWRLEHLKPKEIDFPESVDEIVAAIESEARARQCHIVWHAKNSNIHDFGYAMRAARSLVQALCSREPRKKFTVVDPASLRLRTVEEFSHSCAKYQKAAEKEAKSAEKDATEQ